MTKLNKKRDEYIERFGLALVAYPLVKEQLQISMKSGWDLALAEVMPMMREMAEKSRSLGHAVVMGQKEDIIFATKELSDVLNKYNELVGK